MVSYVRNPGFRYGGFTVSTTPDSGCNSGRYIQKWLSGTNLSFNALARANCNGTTAAGEKTGTRFNALARANCN